MRRVFDASDLPQAQLIVDLLQSHRIESHLFNVNSQGGLGELPFVNPEVWVEELQDVQKARKLIKEFEDSHTVSGNSTCADCNETNPANFDYCWQCGALLP